MLVTQNLEIISFKVNIDSNINILKSIYFIAREHFTLIFSSNQTINDEVIKHLRDLLKANYLDKPSLLQVNGF